MPQGRYQLSQIEGAAPSAAGAGRFRLADVETEPPLTLQRRAPGAPSALEADHHPDIASARAAADARRSPFSLALEEAGETFGRFATNNLPAIAATGATIASAPASVPALLTTAGIAALAGGAAVPVQEGLRRAAGDGRPRTAEELGLDVLTEGAIQGGAQLAGGVLTRGATAALRGAAPLATKGAERVASRVLNVSDKLARKSPGVNIPLEAARVGARIGPKGERALSTQIQVLKDRATNAIAASDATLRRSDAVSPARALLRETQELGDVALDDVAAIEDEIARFIGNDAEISVEKMNAIRRWLGKRAKFGAASVPARAEAQQALVRGAREAVGRAVPEAGAANAEMSRRIPVLKAMQDAAARNATASGPGLRMGAGGVLGALPGMLTGDPATTAVTGLLGAIGTRAVAAPNNQLRAASGLYRAGQALQPLAGAAPFVERNGSQAASAAFRAALLEALAADEPLDNVGRPIANGSTVRP